MPKITRRLVDRQIGNRLRALRMSRDISQANLGNALGITFQQVQKYEQGSNRLSVSTLLLVAEFFKVSPQFFFEGLANIDFDDASPEASEVQIFAYARSVEGSRLIRTLLAIEKSSIRRKVIAIVEALATTP